MSVNVLDANNPRTYGGKTVRHGIRTITIEQLPLNDKEKTFTFVVNGHKVFCKGGNWVPPDSIYARITREKEYALLKYAKDANFNMIRVWGDDGNNGKVVLYSKDGGATWSEMDIPFLVVYKDDKTNWSPTLLPLSSTSLFMITASDNLSVTTERFGMGPISTP